MEEGGREEERRKGGTQTSLGSSLLAQQLRILHCHCSSSGRCCGAGSIPGPGTFACHEHGQKKKKKK